MKKKKILTIAFLISLLPMLLNQYGGLKGVQEITGMINLLNPIGMGAVVLFFIGVWVDFQKPMANTILGAIGVVGVVLAEIYEFFTWHVMTITGEISMQHSIQLAFPEFYFGLVVSISMVVLYVVVNRKI